MRYHVPLLSSIETRSPSGSLNKVREAAVGSARTDVLFTMTEASSIAASRSAVHDNVRTRSTGIKKAGFTESRAVFTMLQYL